MTDRCESTGQPVHSPRLDVNSSGGDLLIASLQAEIAELRQENERLRSAKFRVSVKPMKESHRGTYRVTHWVTIDRPDRPLDAQPWDVGRITPFMSESEENAKFEAEGWEEFFNPTEDQK